MFWLRDGAVERCEAKDCAGPKLITDDPKVPTGNPSGTIMVTDGAFVAWIASNFGGTLDVYACGVAGSNGASPKAANGLNDAPTQLAISGSNLYVTQATGAVHGGPIATLVVPGIDASAIAADAKFAVWAIPGSATVADGTIRSVTVSDGFVYWANRGITGGSVWRAAL